LNNVARFHFLRRMQNCGECEVCCAGRHGEQAARVMVRL
jgi:hypothetical protein